MDTNGGDVKRVETAISKGAYLRATFAAPLPCSSLLQGLGLPVCGCASEPWAVAAVRSKRQFREACVAAGVPTPRYLHLGIPTAAPAPAPDACTLLSADRGRAEDADQLLLQLPKRLQAAGVRFPVVMKPVGGAGSFSVTRADDVGQLEAAVRGFWSSLPAYLSTSGQAADSPAATGMQHSADDGMYLSWDGGMGSSNSIGLVCCTEQCITPDGPQVGCLWRSSSRDTR